MVIYMQKHHTENEIYLSSIPLPENLHCSFWFLLETAPPVAKPDRSDVAVNINDIEIHENNKDVDIEKGVHKSHNTAATTNQKTKTLTESSEISAKKKCCTILWKKFN